jgi:excisionase family DNA binding protein
VSLPGAESTCPQTLPVAAGLGRLLPLTAQKGRKGQGAKEDEKTGDNITRFSRGAEPDTVLRLGAAEYLHVSVRTVWRLVDSGHLHPVRLPGVARVLFDRAELDRLIEASK